MAIRVAVDAVGGDHAPGVVVDGAVEAAKQAAGQYEILLVGPESLIQEHLSRHDTSHLPIQVVHAPEIIGMDESPTAAVKTKRLSSIHVGLGIHKAGQADAFVSAGNTGAVMAASLFVLGRLPTVARPSIVGYYPTTTSFCVVLDVGANVDCRAEHLVQFAHMGSIYAERVLKRPEPTVALMNIGEEASKGNEAVKAAYELLSQTPGLNFRGNIEGRDLMNHGADVVVCDGFIGNIMLKLGESVRTVLAHFVAREMVALNLSDDQQSLVNTVLDKMTSARFNYEEFGGAPLLGVNGNVLIGHGGSTLRAVKQMIRRAVEVVREDISTSIASALTA